MKHTIRYITLLCALLPLVAGAQTNAASAANPAIDWLTDGVTVTEDSNVRIEQTRRRGQVERLRVFSKVGQGSRYEITLRAGRDPSALDLAGKSAWHVLSF